MCNVILIDLNPFDGDGTEFAIQLDCLIDPIVQAIRDAVEAFLTPAIGLPVMEGSSGRWIALSASPSNPWDELVGSSGSGFGLVPGDPGMYWWLVLPLSLALLTIATAFLSIRAGTLSKVEAQKQFRRLGIGYLTCFFWIPVASICLNFFNFLAMVVSGMCTATGSQPYPVCYSAGTVSSVVGDMVVNGIVGGALIGYVASWALVPLLLVAVIFTVAVVVARWLLIIIITLAMPLIAAFWAIDVWPLNKFSEMATSVTGTYAGLLVSGLPTAFLFRVVVEVDRTPADFGAAGLVEAIMVMLLPVYIIKTTVVMTQWAAGSAGEIAGAGSQVARRAARANYIGDQVDEHDDEDDGTASGGPNDVY